MKNTEISIHTKYIFQVIFCLSFRDGTLKKGLQLNGGHLDLGTVPQNKQPVIYMNTVWYSSTENFKHIVRVKNQHVYNCTGNCMTHIQPIKIEFIKNNASVCVVSFKFRVSKLFNFMTNRKHSNSGFMFFPTLIISVTDF